MKTADISKHQMTAFKKLNAEIHYHSRFNFLNSHRGYRPAAMHLFLGIAGGGKSTLVRSMILDLLASEDSPRVLLWLSEESFEDYITELSLIPNLPNLDRLMIVSEQSDNFNAMSREQQRAHFELCISESSCDLILYDNITTSSLYMGDGFKSEQSWAVDLKKLCSKHGKPLILFAHTGGGVSEFYDKLIQPNDVRGSKTIVNLVQFLYVMQQFKVGDSKLSTIRICKNRGQDTIGTFYTLTYASRFRVYLEDTMVDFEKFKEIYKSRNTL